MHTLTLKFRRILALLLLAALLFGAAACKDVPGPEPIDGGKVDNTDPNAPKVIESTVLTDFNAAFFLAGRRSASAYPGTFRFDVRPNSEGKPIVMEGVTGAVIAADESIFDDIRAIIDENDLASMNGVVRYTAGLDPNEFLCEVTAHYASGEKLHFSIDNDPTAKWAEQLYDLFADRFEAAGVTALRSASDSSPIVNFRISMTEDGVRTDYGVTKVDASEAIDGQTELFRKLVVDPSTNTVLSKQYAKIPENYGERLSQIFAAYAVDTKYEQSFEAHDDGYYGFAARPESEENGSTSLLFNAAYESGTRLMVITAKPSELAGAEGFLSALFDYFDSILG